MSVRSFLIDVLCEHFDTRKVPINNKPNLILFMYE